jgi:hypothetical protein
MVEPTVFSLKADGFGIIWCSENVSILSNVVRRMGSVCGAACHRSALFPVT